MNALVLSLLLVFATLLVACGGEAEATCTNVRGGEDAPVSLWACASDEQAEALRKQRGFASCARVEGMDADERPGDLAYQCRR